MLLLFSSDYQTDTARHIFSSKDQRVISIKTVRSHSILPCREQKSSAQMPKYYFEHVMLEVQE